jgi:hypothetical protein
MLTPALNFESVDAFLRSDAEGLHAWVTRSRSRLVWFSIAAIVVGSGLYGAVVGSWRDSWQALHNGIKLPLVILLTALGNGLLNGMLASLLGLNLGFRQSLVLVLISFAMASLILGALSPVALFLVWNTPPLGASTGFASLEYGFLQLTLAVFIASAGILGNLRLLPLLRRWTNKPAVARKVLFAWLAGNLFLGSQLAWILRPFIGAPNLPVEFLRATVFHGNFYETIFNAARRLAFP